MCLLKLSFVIILTGLTISGCNQNDGKNLKPSLKEDKQIHLTKVEPKDIYLEYQVLEGKDNSFFVKYSLQNRSEKLQYLLSTSCEGITPYLIFDTTHFQLLTYYCNQSWIVTSNFAPHSEISGTIEFSKKDHYLPESMSFGLNAVFVDRPLSLKVSKNYNSNVKIQPNWYSGILWGKKISNGNLPN